MTPMKVTAHLAEQVVWYGDGLYLDGLLGWCRLQQLQRQGQAPPHPNHVDWPVDFNLPLDTWRAPLSGTCHPRLLESGVGDLPDLAQKLGEYSGKIWGWRASGCVWPDEYLESSYALRKMPDIDDFVRHTTASRHKISSGKFKAKDKTYPTRFAHQVCWYAMGDPDGVRDLLREMTHLGKLSGLGLGRVMRWEVEKIDEDYSIVRDGALTRRMPASWCEASRPPVRATIRPPYWHGSRRVEQCYPNGTEVHCDT